MCDFFLKLQLERKWRRVHFTVCRTNCSSEFTIYSVKVDLTFFFLATVYYTWSKFRRIFHPLQKSCEYNVDIGSKRRINEAFAWQWTVNWNCKSVRMKFEFWNLWFLERIRIYYLLQFFLLKSCWSCCSNIESHPTTPSHYFNNLLCKLNLLHYLHKRRDSCSH